MDSCLLSCEQSPLSLSHSSYQGGLSHDLPSAPQLSPLLSQPANLRGIGGANSWRVPAGGPADFDSVVFPFDDSAKTMFICSSKAIKAGWSPFHTCMFSMVLWRLSATSLNMRVVEVKLFTLSFQRADEQPVCGRGGCCEGRRRWFCGVVGYNSPTGGGLHLLALLCPQQSLQPSSLEICRIPQLL